MVDPLNAEISAGHLGRLRRRETESAQSVS
jgi:hypothetical protein